MEAAEDEQTTEDAEEVTGEPEEAAAEEQAEKVALGGGEEEERSEETKTDGNKCGLTKQGDLRLAMFHVMAETNEQHSQEGEGLHSPSTEAGKDVRRLRTECNQSVEAIRSLNYTAIHLQDSDVVTLEEMRTAGYSAAEVGEACYTAQQVHAAGYSAAEARKGCRFTVESMLLAGWSIEEVWQAGFTELKVRKAEEDIMKAKRKTACGKRLLTPSAASGATQPAEATETSDARHALNSTCGLPDLALPKHRSDGVKSTHKKF